MVKRNISDAPNYDRDEWYTPVHIIGKARQVMGGIDLDPATCEVAQGVVKAAVYYDKEIDGLNQQWFGRVWLNPPRSRAQEFIDHLENEIAGERIEQATTIIFNATETRYWQLLGEICGLVGIPDKRIRYWRAEGKAISPEQGSNIFYYGPRQSLFAAYFGPLGQIWRLEGHNA